MKLIVRNSTPDAWQYASLQHTTKDTGAGLWPQGNPYSLWSDRAVEPSQVQTFDFNFEAKINPGNNVDTFTVSVRNEGGPNSVFAVVEIPYTVVVGVPAAPSPIGVQFTNNQYSAFWGDPSWIGGSPLTGYRVELVQMEYIGPYDYPTMKTRQLACDFTGRPELQICDFPNNTLTQVLLGEYQIRVWSLSEAFPTVDDSRPHTNFIELSRTFTVVNELSTPPPPGPDPQPDPTPGPDEIVLVTDYTMATNLVSLIHATNYSNKLDAPVLRLYQAYFNRQPDLLGTKYWLDVRRSGYNQFAIAGFMAGSQEFANNYEGVSDSEYLTRVYRNMLGRQYDQAGFNYWLDVLRGTNEFGLNPGDADLSRAEVVFYVSGETEFIHNYPYTK